MDHSVWQLGFCVTKNQSTVAQGRLMAFLHMKGAKIRTSIGAPEVVKHDVKHKLF